MRRQISLRKGLLFIFTIGLLACPPWVQAAPSEEGVSSLVLYPQETFVVARLKSFDSLSSAIERLKGWTHEHPSIEALLDDEDWAQLGRFDLEKSVAGLLDLNEDKFKDYFSGSTSICISSDFKASEKTKALPVVVAMTTKSPNKAEEFLQTVKDDTDVLSANLEANGVEHLRVRQSDKHEASTFKRDATRQPKPVEAKSSEPMDVYMVVYQNKVLMGSSLDYTLSARKALEQQTSRHPVFFDQSQEADVALWIDPRPIFALAKSQMEARAKAAEEKGDPSKVDPKLIDKLGLDEIQGIGMSIDLLQPGMRLEVDTVPEPTGVAKIFACSPQGLSPSPLIPADAQEFTLFRFDSVCLWEELRRIAKMAVPATDTMYQGWKKQILETYGVDIDRQLFGALGDRAVLYTLSSSEKADSLAIYVAVNDPISLTGALDALSGFFTQGKTLFEKSQIKGIPVWRLKNEFQSANTQSVAYAITHEWLIVSIGDPTQMQDLIEGADNHQLENKAFKNDTVSEILKDPTLVSFSHRPLREVLTDIAMIIKETQRKQANVRGGEDDTDDDIPEFDDVKESVLLYSRCTQGLVETNLKIIYEK